MYSTYSSDAAFSMVSRYVPSVTWQWSRKTMETHSLRGRGSGCPPERGSNISADHWQYESTIPSHVCGVYRCTCWTSFQNPNCEEWRCQRYWFATLLTEKERRCEFDCPIQIASWKMLDKRDSTTETTC